MSRELLALCVAEGVMTLVTAVLFGLDKLFSEKKHRRIPEKALLFCTLLFGAVGAWLGIFLFRHKTKHWYFPFAAFVGIVLQTAAFYAVYHLTA